MKRIVFVILLIVIVGICCALTLSPEFCYFWQETPVLRDIYGWFTNNFKSFTDACTKGEFRTLYLTLIGAVIVSVFVFIFIKVKPIKADDEKSIEVTATPIIKNSGLTTVIVIEER